MNDGYANALGKLPVSGAEPMWKLADSAPAEVQLPASHVVVVSHLQEALRGDLPLIVLVGDEGLGKSTLLRRLIIVEGRSRPVIAVGAQMSPLSLLRAIAERLSMPWHELSLASMSDVHDHLRIHGQALGGLVLVADDATRLDEETLEFLRFWCVTPAAKQGLIKLVLGCNSAEVPLLDSRPRSGALADVGYQTVRLGPLDTKDARLLMRSRLRELGVPGEQGLTAGAESVVLEFGRGRPSQLVNAVDVVIRDALDAESFPVSGRFARAALTGRRQAPKRSVTTRQLLVVGLVVVVIFGLALDYARGGTIGTSVASRVRQSFELTFREDGVVRTEGRVLAAEAGKAWDRLLGWEGWTQPQDAAVPEEIRAQVEAERALAEMASTDDAQPSAESTESMTTAGLAQAEATAPVEAPPMTTQAAPAETTEAIAANAQPSQPRPVETLPLPPPAEPAEQQPASVPNNAVTAPPATSDRVPARTQPNPPAPSSAETPQLAAASVGAAATTPRAPAQGPRCSDDILLRGGVPAYRNCINPEGQRVEVKLWVVKSGETMNGLIYSHDGLPGGEGRRQFELLNPGAPINGPIPAGTIVRIPLQH